MDLIDQIVSMLETEKKGAKGGRRYSPEFKSLVAEAIEKGVCPKEISQRTKVSRGSLSSWTSSHTPPKRDVRETGAIREISITPSPRPKTPLIVRIGSWALYIRVGVQ